MAGTHFSFNFGYMQETCGKGKKTAENLRKIARQKKAEKALFLASLERGLSTQIKFSTFYFLTCTIDAGSMPGKCLILHHANNDYSFTGNTARTKTRQAMCLTGERLWRRSWTLQRIVRKSAGFGEGGRKALKARVRVEDRRGRGMARGGVGAARHTYTGPQQMTEEPCRGQPQGSLRGERR